MAGKRLLIVDDEPSMARLMKTHLERDGHTVTTMSSSLEVLAAIDGGARFDVYVLDIQMQRGEPHGLSLAKMLEHRHPTAVCIFVTGDPDMASHGEFRGRTVLGKPIDFDALRRAVVGTT